MENDSLIQPHGGYKNLKSYKMSTIVQDFTVEFCNRYIENRDRTNRTDRTNGADKSNQSNLSNQSNSTYGTNSSLGKNGTYRTYGTNRTWDQMVQAARSGKQNIAEGSQDSATSQKIELKLTSVARGSLEELKADYEDFLRQKGLKLWSKDDTRAKEIRNLAYRTDKSYTTYSSYMEDAETAANCAICVINQTNFLLDRQIKALEEKFLKEGGFTERMHRTRSEKRKKQADQWGTFNRDQELSPEEFAKKLEEELKDYDPEEE